MFFIVIFIIFILLVINEWYSRKKINQNEFDRKIIHILVGSFVAFWPFLISYQEIRLISLAFLLVILISKKINLFSSIHSVKRSTFGEIFFAISVGLITFLTQNHYIYLIAILEMGLADGLAAILGVSFGKTNQYKIFKHVKSLVGSLTFFLVSLAILLLSNYFGHINVSDIFLIILALLLTVLENISIFGLDNLTVPILTVLLIR